MYTVPSWKVEMDSDLSRKVDLVRFCTWKLTDLREFHCNFVDEEKRNQTLGQKRANQVQLKLSKMIRELDDASV